MSGRDGLGVGDGSATWTGRGVLDADDLERVRRRLADVLPGDDAVRLLATLDAERASHVRAVLLVPVLEKQRDDAQLQLEEIVDDLAAARVSLEDNRVLVQELAEWILNRPRSTDHACSRCIPGGEIVVPGFVCAWHIAEGLRAAATGGS